MDHWLPCGMISVTCLTTIVRNDWKYKYSFMFPDKQISVYGVDRGHPLLLAVRKHGRCSVHRSINIRILFQPNFVHKTAVNIFWMHDSMPCEMIWKDSSHWSSQPVLCSQIKKRLKPAIILPIGQNNLMVMFRKASNPCLWTHGLHCVHIAIKHHSLHYYDYVYRASHTRLYCKYCGIWPTSLIDFLSLIHTSGWPVH